MNPDLTVLSILAQNLRGEFKQGQTGFHKPGFVALTFKSYEAQWPLSEPESCCLQIHFHFQHIRFFTYDPVICQSLSDQNKRKKVRHPILQTCRMGFRLSSAVLRLPYKRSYKMEKITNYSLSSEKTDILLRSCSCYSVQDRTEKTVTSKPFCYGSNYFCFQCL